MNIAWYALWFIVAVSLLVTVHEFGHFWVARRLGFKVLRFSVGFGKPLFERTGQGRHGLLARHVPLGGYVKMLDEREGPGRRPQSCPAPSPASRPGSASWCCSRARRSTSFSPSWCSGGCSGPRAPSRRRARWSAMSWQSPWPRRAGLRSGDVILAVDGQDAEPRRHRPARRACSRLLDVDQRRRRRRR